MKKILKFVKDCILFILVFLAQNYILLLFIYQGAGDFMMYEQEPSKALVPGGWVVGGQDDQRTEFTEYGQRVLWISNIIFLFSSFMITRMLNKLFNKITRKLNMFFNKLVEDKRKKLKKYINK